MLVSNVDQNFLRPRNCVMFRRFVTSDLLDGSFILHKKGENSSTRSGCESAFVELPTEFFNILEPQSPTEELKK